MRTLNAVCFVIPAGLYDHIRLRDQLVGQAVLNSTLKVIKAHEMVLKFEKALMHPCHRKITNIIIIISFQSSTHFLCHCTSHEIMPDLTLYSTDMAEFLN